MLHTLPGAVGTPSIWTCLCLPLKELNKVARLSAAKAPESFSGSDRQPGFSGSCSPTDFGRFGIRPALLEDVNGMIICPGLDGIHPLLSDVSAGVLMFNPVSWWSNDADSWIFLEERSKKLKNTLMTACKSSPIRSEPKEPLVVRGERWLSRPCRRARGIHVHWFSRKAERSKSETSLIYLWRGPAHQRRRMRENNCI